MERNQSSYREDTQHKNGYGTVHSRGVSRTHSNTQSTALNARDLPPDACDWSRTGGRPVGRWMALVLRLETQTQTQTASDNQKRWWGHAEPERTVVCRGLEAVTQRTTLFNYLTDPCLFVYCSASPNKAKPFPVKLADASSQDAPLPWALRLDKNRALTHNEAKTRPPMSLISPIDRGLMRWWVSIHAIPSPRREV